MALHALHLGNLQKVVPVGIYSRNAKTLPDSHKKSGKHETSLIGIM